MTQIFIEAEMNGKVKQGILFDGSVGFRFCFQKDSNAKVLELCPLKEKQEVGGLKNGNGIDKDGESFVLIFQKEKSIDVFIVVLKKLKEMNPKE